MSSGGFREPGGGRKEGPGMASPQSQLGELFWQIPARNPRQEGGERVSGCCQRVTAGSREQTQQRGRLLMSLYISRLPGAEWHRVGHRGQDGLSLADMTRCQ